MRFAPTVEQIQFAETIRSILATERAPAAMRIAGVTADGAVDGLWETLAATGVVGMAAPPAHGGLNMGPSELIPILKEFGRAACPEPLAGHAAVVVPILARWAPEPMAAEWLNRAASGEALLVAGSPVDDLVLAAHRADLLVLCRGEQIHAVPAELVSCSDQPSVDSSRRASLVDWTPGEATLVVDDPRAVTEVLDRGALAAAAEAVGVAERLLETTVAYVSDREQFGRPVGSNQAVKHHCADLAVAVEFAQPVVAMAAWSMTEGRSPTIGGTVSGDVSMAKALASDAVDRACRTALQCHGAIGYTAEHHLQLWLKRGWILSATWGNAAHHRQRLADLLELR